MFPLNSNTPYIEDSGKRARLGDVLGGGSGSELPEYSEADAGKVLAVDDTGDLEWATVSVGNTNFGIVGVHTRAGNVSVEAKEGT